MKSLLGRVGVVLIGLAIFGYAEVWGAECAWVLWKKYERVSENRTVTWELIGAVPQYQECLKMQKKVLEGDKKFWKESLKDSVTLSDWMISIKTVDGAIGMITYECFPDTIDPRK